MKKFKFTIKGHEYDVEIKQIEGNVANVEVNGTQYQVQIDKELPATKTPTLVRTAAPPPTEKVQLKSSAFISTITAPLPGNIIEILVKPGDVVKKEQKLLVMEAMKMENNILSEKEGTVKTLKVKQGDTVLQGDVLLEIE